MCAARPARESRPSQGQHAGHARVLYWQRGHHADGFGARRRSGLSQRPRADAARWSGLQGLRGIVALLLDHGADVDADNGGGMTPIMCASLFGRSKAVEQLKPHRASLQRRNRFGIFAKWMVRLSGLISWLPCDCGRLKPATNPPEAGRESPRRSTFVLH